MIVSNTTPISNLLHLNQIKLLEMLFDHVYIPQAVADEVNVAFHSSVSWQSVVNSGIIIIKEAVNDLLIRQMMPYLHRGEIEAITLGLENNAKLCLMDDRDGRDVALKNNLPVTGTLGILLKAKEMGHIYNVKTSMDTLRSESHFWISENMYIEVLKRAGELGY